MQGLDFPCTCIHINSVGHPQTLVRKGVWKQLLSMSNQVTLLLILQNLQTTHKYHQILIPGLGLGSEKDTSYNIVL